MKILKSICCRSVLLLAATCVLVSGCALPEEPPAVGEGEPSTEQTLPMAGGQEPVVYRIEAGFLDDDFYRAYGLELYREYHVDGDLHIRLETSPYLSGEEGVVTEGEITAEQWNGLLSLEAVDIAWGESPGSPADGLVMKYEPLGRLALGTRDEILRQYPDPHTGSGPAREILEAVMALAQECGVEGKHGEQLAVWMAAR